MIIKLQGIHKVKADASKQSVKAIFSGSDSEAGDLLYTLHTDVVFH